MSDSDEEVPAADQPDQQIDDDDMAMEDNHVELVRLTPSQLFVPPDLFPLFPPLCLSLG